jgi:hypothetical protein
MHNSLKIIKTLLYYSALHVSGTLAPIIRSFLILHIQPPVTYQLKHIFCFQIMWMYVTIYNLYSFLIKICYMYKNNKTRIINVIPLLVFLCCFIFVSSCVVDGYCYLSLVFIFVFVFYCIIVFQIRVLYFVSCSNDSFFTYRVSLGWLYLPALVCQYCQYGLMMAVLCSRNIWLLLDLL